MNDGSTQPGWLTWTEGTDTFDYTAASPAGEYDFDITCTVENTVVTSTQEITVALPYNNAPVFATYDLDDQTIFNYETLMTYALPVCTDADGDTLSPTWTYTKNS
jgi:hypothetical protein